MPSSWKRGPGGFCLVTWVMAWWWGVWGIIFNPGQLWKRLACGREVSKHKALGQAKSMTDRGTVAQTGAQSPGMGRGISLRSHQANESWRPCLPLTKWWPHLETVDPPILIHQRPAGSSPFARRPWHRTGGTGAGLCPQGRSEFSARCEKRGPYSQVLLLISSVRSELGVVYRVRGHSLSITHRKLGTISVVRNYIF